MSHLIEDNLSPLDVEQSFEDTLSGCYPETVKVGWLELDTITVLKEQDPVSWRIAMGEHMDAEVEDGNAFTLDGGSSYFWTHDLETYLDDNDLEKVG